ncbi:hypothetical protein BD289DRAFT_85389 [Coniella lustricola]|uniref:Uncharacterized protein n=1 Tax=Coniella lustricola TaxID=2025994 RepID=A0A2T2ZYV8_9PEZI|nr:hypothetical protein BD289DRAFT_85389 [Coniella lustricola]
MADEAAHATVTKGAPSLEYVLQLLEASHDAVEAARLGHVRVGTILVDDVFVGDVTEGIVGEVEEVGGLGRDGRQRGRRGHRAGRGVAGASVCTAIERHAPPRRAETEGARSLWDPRLSTAPTQMVDAMAGGTGRCKSRGLSIGSLFCAGSDGRWMDEHCFGVDSG